MQKAVLLRMRGDLEELHLPSMGRTAAAGHARDRVERELPAGRPPPPVTFLQEMVTQTAQRLRVDHECQHWWTYRPGGGQCEHCFHYLPQYLLVRSPLPWSYRLGANA